jgi:diadenosine tetraphosphate (Ap4A) HIT family hydrolase
MANELNSIFPARSAEQCRFCGFLSDNKSTNAVDRPWLTNEHYSAVVSVGALTPGWSLICPIEHKLNLSVDFKKDCFWRFVGIVTAHLRSTYGLKVQCFEHGPSVPGSLTGCGTDHAHLHVVPLDFDLADEVVGYDSSIYWHESFVYDIPDLVGDKEYLLLVTKFDGIYTRGRIAILEEGRSQFFRKVIAKKLGIAAQYDYKVNPMLEIASKTANLLHATVLDQQGLQGHAGLSRACGSR